jgi:PucR family transcriptional regulator, proline-responsive transcriptional activator
MEITLDMILYRLKYSNSSLHGKDFSGSLIRSVKILDKSKTEYKSDVLYITTASSFPKKIPGHLVFNIICLKDGAQLPVLNKEYKFNLIIIKNHIDINILHEEILEIINVYNQWSNKLLNSMFQGSNFQDIIDTGYELLENPMNITDIGLRLYAHTKIGKTDDSTWNNLTQKGYISEDSIPTAEFKKLIQKQRNANLPIIVDPGSFKHSVLLANILADNKRVGTLAVLDFNRPFRNSDIPLARFLSMVISQLMQKDQLIHNKKGIGYEFLIIDLLEGRHQNKKIVEERLKYLNWEINKNIYVIAVSPKNPAITYEKILKTRDRMANLFSNGKTIVYENDIVIILSTKKEYPLEVDLNRLTVFLEKTDMYGGISQCFNSLFEIKKYYKQALKAVDMGAVSEKGNLFFYKDFILNYMMDICAEREELKTFCHPSLFSLMEYDKKNHVSFIETLHVYIKNSGNQLATAKFLFIHRSTLLYRLDKIEKIMHINLKDYDTLFHLHLSFKILDYLKSQIFKQKEE